MKSSQSVRRDETQTDVDAVVKVVSQLVSKMTGIQLGDKQHSMVLSRLAKRMSDLKIESHRDYLDHLEEHREQETNALISLLTTHHTYFFREFSHFEYLERSGLQTLVDGARKRGENKLRIWSAACSHGQEVYSLAMFLNHHLSKIAPDFTYEILGTDVDQDSVARSANGVYRYREIAEVPMMYLASNWARGSGDIIDFVKAKSSLKSHCQFKTMSLLNLSKKDLVKPFDLIFCRNVFIYFTSAQIKEITAQLLTHLTPTGLLFIGISESLHGLELPVNVLGPSIYSLKSNSAEKPPTRTTPATNVTPLRPAVPALPTVLRVLCVDDSPSVLSLLKKVLSKENGFEVVATAGNGIEAAEALKKYKVDVMTLDIHMPVQTGIEYLQKNFNSAHPPVVMISSVARDNADLAMTAIKFGASDYIEKPALSNMQERGDEIGAKLRCAARNKNDSHKQVNNSLDKSFQRIATLMNPEKAFRLISAGLSDRNKLTSFFLEVQGTQPTTVILIEGAENALPLFATELAAKIGRPVAAIESHEATLAEGKIYVGDFSKYFVTLKKKFESRDTSAIVYGELSKHAAASVVSWKRVHLLVEDLGGASHALKAHAADVVPATSFAYMSCENLGRKRDK
jgi:chemotaxis protein methyltransferase CheR